MILRLYPSDTLRSSPLAARANLNVAIPSSRVARARELERLPSPASVIHSRQKSSAQYISFCIRVRNTNSPAIGRLASATPETKFDLASVSQQTPIAAESRTSPSHPRG